MNSNQDQDVTMDVVKTLTKTTLDSKEDRTRGASAHGSNSAAASQSAAAAFPEGYENDLVCPSIWVNKGVVLHFVNYNCPEAVSVIGAIRLELTDIKRIPSYLTKNEGLLRQYALHYLLKHYKRNHCGLGATEKLKADDFNMSYGITSLSAQGRLCNTGRRFEGPIHFCFQEGMLEEMFIGNLNNMEGDYAHIVNIHISLLAQAYRREVIIERDHELRASLKAEKPNPPAVETPAAASAANAKKKEKKKNAKKRAASAKAAGEGSQEKKALTAAMQAINANRITMEKVTKALKPEPALPKSFMNWGPGVSLPNLPSGL